MFFLTIQMQINTVDYFLKLTHILSEDVVIKYVLELKHILGYSYKSTIQTLYLYVMKLLTFIIESKPKI